MKQWSCKIKYGILNVIVPGWQESFKSFMLRTLNVTSHVDPYLHVHHPRCLLYMSIDFIVAGWQETFRSKSLLPAGW